MTCPSCAGPVRVSTNREGHEILIPIYDYRIRRSCDVCGRAGR